MATLIGGPRALLKRLREAMAEPLDAQKRLNKIVDLIANNMRADVCSFYVLRDDGALELFATHGLKSESVHLTTLRLGEGLVGRIAADAEPLNLTDATTHPGFAYRPETGEDPYRAFLGVPVLRSGQTLGVLVVQDVSHRIYSEEETEALLTTATLLAEMLSTAEFDSLIKPGSDIDLRRPRLFSVVGFSEGIALGHVVLHDPRVVVANFIAEDIEEEKARLDRALETMRVSIDALFDRGDMQINSEHYDILESYRMFANDRGWVRRMEEAIDSGLSAEAAVERVQNDTRARMMRQTDPYIRERLHDLDDLANRLLRALTGNGQTGPVELPDNAIVVARNMGPADLLEYDRSKLRGLVFEEGTAIAHVAIVARSLGLIAVGQADSIVSMCETGDDIIVDASGGTVHLRPPSDVVAAYIEKVRLSAKRQKKYAALRTRKSVTRDGVRVALLHNSGLIADLHAVNDTGAEGVGLFRTELQFMIAAHLPRLTEQVELYSEAMKIVGDKPIVFRLLDIGGDKVIPYIRSAPEENPAMGWRSLRLALDRPGLIRTQVRALLQAAKGRPLKILVPMVTEVREFRQARMVVRKEAERLAHTGAPVPEKIEVGAMIEVPSLLFELDLLLPECDFASIGSNDLIQFLTATDRANPRVADKYDPIDRPRLRAIRHVVRACRDYNVPLAMCGELAGHPVEALALLSIGLTRLSMGASSIGPVKDMILHLELGPIQRAVATALDDIDNDRPVRELITELARRQKLPI